MKTYIAYVYKDPDSSYGVSFPDLPGCYATGETYDEALESAKVSLREYAEALREDGEDMPPPRKFGDLVAAEVSVAEKVELAARVWVEVPLITAGRARRANISVDEDLLAAIDRYAVLAGINRSALLARMAIEWLERTTNVVTLSKPMRNRRAAVT